MDVNVHPAKAEVRLRNDRHVFGLVQRPIRAALSGIAPIGSEPATAWPRPQISAFSAPVFMPSGIDRPGLELRREPQIGKHRTVEEVGPPLLECALPRDCVILGI